MTLAQEFNSLNGLIIHRKYLEKLLEKAEKEKHTIISKRIIKVLEAFDDDTFLVEINNLIEPYGLNAPIRAKKLVQKTIKTPIKNNFTAVKKKSTVQDQKTQQAPGLNASEKPLFDEKAVQRMHTINLEVDLADYALKSYLNDKGFASVNVTDEIRQTQDFKKLDSDYKNKFKQSQNIAKYLGKDISKPSMMQRQSNLKEYNRRLSDEIEKKHKKIQTPGLNAPEISTEKFRKMSVAELRRFTLNYYNENLKGKKVTIKNHLKEVVFVGGAGRKMLQPIYSEKVAVIEHLEELIKNSTYNNWGDRKEKDSPVVLGYLNFKSKITIDGQKRHVRISVILDENRKTKLKTFEVGDNKKSDDFHEVRFRNPKDEGKKPLSENKDTKKGLNSPNPIKKPIATPKPIQNMQSKKALTDLEKMGFVSANSVPKEASGVYTLGGEIGKFLQKQQPHKSLILIKGNKHSSKSQLAMQIANSYAENNELVAYIDYEQGGIDSKDTVESINRNTSEAGRKNISIIGYIEKPFEELQKFCKVCKVIVADSVTDLKITADQLNELRNKHPKITWIFISQVKENGAMYGGNKMAHNPTVVIDCSSHIDPKNRIAKLEKNRGNDIELKYSMFYKKVIIDKKNNQTPGTEVQLIKPRKLSFTVN